MDLVKLQGAHPEHYRLEKEEEEKVPQEWEPVVEEHGLERVTAPGRRNQSFLENSSRCLKEKLLCRLTFSLHAQGWPPLSVAAVPYSHSVFSSSDR